MDKNVALLLTLVLGLIAVFGGVFGVYYIYNEGVTGASTAQDDSLTVALLAQAQMEQKVQDLQKKLTDSDVSYQQKLKELQAEALKQIEEAQTQAETEAKPVELTCDEKVAALESEADSAEEDVQDVEDDVVDYEDKVLADQTEISRLSGLIVNTTDSAQLNFLRDRLRDVQRDLNDDQDELDNARDDLDDAQDKEDDIKKDLRRTRSSCRNQ